MASFELDMIQSAGVGALALGYPNMEPLPPKPRKEDYYRIIK